MKTKVLCVDDDLVVAHLLADVVVFCGLQPVICLNVVDAVRLLKDTQIKAILTDHVLPKLSGLDLLEIAQERRPDIRRVLITATYDDSSVKEAATSTVVQMVIPKPFSLADVKMALVWL